MTQDEIYEFLDALEALNEKCLEGYSINLKYDPEFEAFWLKWSPPHSDEESWSGRGIKGCDEAFTADAFTRLVRDFVRDADRITNLRDFQDRHRGKS